MLLVPLHGDYFIRKYHAISHGLKTKKRIPRKQAPIDAYPGLFISNALGRVFTVNSRQTECFYLRLLLVSVTGPLSFQDIHKVNGQQYQKYKDACLALGLLENDMHAC